VGPISILLRKAPYGSADAAEAVRHAMGGVTEDLSVSLILVDAGVSAALTGQDPSGTAYLSIEEGIRDCLDMGVDVYVDRSSLREYQLDARRIIPGVREASASETVEVIQNSDTVLVF
jgi:sulfur relay (sulfurtransferase) DsrF/TusC family protein